jgi:hypothetical protein
MSKPVSEASAEPATDEPIRQHSPELLAIKRRAEEMGIAIRLPTPNPNWEPPEPLPIPADVVSRIVVQQRRSRGF